MQSLPRPLPLLVSTLLLAAVAGAQSPDPATQLRAKEIDKRLAAIDAVAASGKKDADLTLQPLLRDPDWEVQEHVATALGRMQSKTSMGQLTDLAVDGDIVRIRRAAALASAAIDPADAANRIVKKMKPKAPVASLEALALVLRGQPAFADADKLKKLVKEPTALVREAAAVAWFEGAADRAEAFRALMAEPPLALRCRVLEAIAEAPRSGDLALLIPLLEGPGLNEVVARRVLQAIAGVFAAGAADRAAAAALLQRSATDGIVLARRARLLPLLVRGDKPVLDKAAAVAALQPCLRGKDGNARGAAARALREIGGDEALQAALAHFPSEPDGRVQLQLVETVTALRPPSTPEAVAWLVQVAGSGAADVRERAIVRLGKSGVQGAADVLIATLRDSEWTLACCAAVSLGKTDDDRALEPLVALLQHADWKLRGAAIVGLMHWSREAAMEPVLGMLADANPVVAGAAHQALRVLSRRYDAPPDQKAWRAWWAQAKGKHDFTDREASMDKLKKYGYAVPNAEIYQGLDVVVFKSRGDHIEQLLERLEIVHRTTEQDRVSAAGIHPEAIFVANCTGELAAADVEPLAWFVRTGGSLFGSCWALSETIARIHPGVMRMAATRDQVMDDVRAMPCRADSPLLNGVFPPSVVPIYHLEGSHLIQVLDPDRCEVLIDSPDAAERWGCGNLAAWFHSGHGVLFDSANHFDLQGLEKVIGLKTDKDRQAYAIDHMGMTLATWRTTRSEAYWKSPPKASKSVPDLSAFRLLTNFVRSKRSGGL
ncbi:MAG: HEAT repeat domain-containing protein [Planctomycetota bacterium]